jgi:cation transport ATPase
MEAQYQEKIAAQKAEEERRKREEEYRKSQEEKERQRIEVEEKIKIEKEDTAAKERIQRRVKIPVFCAVSVFALFFNGTMKLMLGLTFGRMLFAFGTLMFLLFIYYWLFLPAFLDATHETLKHRTETGEYKPTKFDNFIFYGVTVLIVTIVFDILYFLVMHFLLKLW